MLAEVVELGDEAAEMEGIAVGQRVVLNPVISCYMRGLEPCRMCRTGEPGLCTRTAEGSLSPGMLTGFCRDLPGGWSTDMVAHWSQIVPVPDEISDDVAVLIEPFSVAVHAVLKDPPPAWAKVLIIGSGSIGLVRAGSHAHDGHQERDHYAGPASAAGGNGPGAGRGQRAPG